jgi:hypothetical protein
MSRKILLLDDPRKVLRCLWLLKHMEWLPVELFHAILERNGIVVPSSGLQGVPTGSGALKNAANHLRDSGLITDSELDVILNPDLAEKQKLIQLHDLV